MTTPVLPKKLQAQIKWPDRSHRSLAEVWRLTPSDVAAEYARQVEAEVDRR